MKKIFLILFVLIIFTVSCKVNKEPISSEKFQSVMEKNGFSVENIDIPESQKEVIKEVLLAKNDDYQIVYYITHDSDKAIRFFNSGKEEIMLSKGNATIESSKSIGNQSRYSLKANSKFKLISRIENTLIYVDAPDTYEKNIKEILKEL